MNDDDVVTTKGTDVTRVRSGALVFDAEWARDQGIPNSVWVDLKLKTKGHKCYLPSGRTLDENATRNREFVASGSVIQCSECLSFWMLSYGDLFMIPCWTQVIEDDTCENGWRYVRTKLFRRRWIHDGGGYAWPLLDLDEKGRRKTLLI